MLADRLYEWLAQTPGPDADRIFAAALEHAEPAWADRIIQVLLNRGQDESWVGIVSRYESLSRDVRQKLRADPDRLHASIALTIQSGTSTARANALAALNDSIRARTAYVIPAALRDPLPKTRVLAGRVLRRMAEHVLDQSAPPAGDEEAQRLLVEDRRQLVLALREAIRTLDVHGRTEVLETALWFAADLGRDLWNVLEARRSRASIVVQEHLYEWEHPRLAGFLLLALLRPAWRDAAARMLQGWSTLPAVSAVLSAGKEVDSEALRGALGAVTGPRWFEPLGELLQTLPEAELSLLPRWVPCLGLSEEQKVALLGRMTRVNAPALHRSAVYALARLRSADAQLVLRQVSESDSPLADFARWCVIGRPVCLQRRVAGPSAAPRAAPRTVQPTKEPAETSPAERWFSSLWRICRRLEPEQRRELVVLLRDFADAWHTSLKVRLHSPAAKERLLALQVVSVPRLVRRFQDQFAALTRDPVEVIRQLAQRLERSATDLPGTPTRTRPREGTTGRRVDCESMLVAQQELDSLLGQLDAGTLDPTDPERIERLRGLLAEALLGELHASAEAEVRG
ncbi:MAG: hypothetical protein HRF50_00165 [Phycisphaerae bacterium]|jgi:hypothetical protein